MHAETHPAEEKGFNQSKVNVSLLPYSCLLEAQPRSQRFSSNKEAAPHGVSMETQIHKGATQLRSAGHEESTSLQLTYQLVPASHRAPGRNVYLGAFPL